MVASPSSSLNRQAGTHECTFYSLKIQQAANRALASDCYSLLISVEIHLRRRTVWIRVAQRRSVAGWLAYPLHRVDLISQSRTESEWSAQTGVLACDRGNNEGF